MKLNIHRENTDREFFSQGKERGEGIAFPVGVDTICATWNDIRIPEPQRFPFSPVSEERQRNDRFMWSTNAIENEEQEDQCGVLETWMNGIPIQTWKNRIGQLCLGVRQSIPVYCHGHNIRAAGKIEVEQWMNAVDDILTDLGCCDSQGEVCDARCGTLQSLHGCQDGLTPRPIDSCIAILKTFRPPNEKAKFRMIYDESVAYGCKARRWNIYFPQKKELKKGKRRENTEEFFRSLETWRNAEGLPPLQPLRFELQLNGAGNIKSANRVGFHTLGALLANFDRLESLMHEQLRQCLFRRGHLDAAASCLRRRDFATDADFVVSLKGKPDLKMEGALSRLAQQPYELALSGTATDRRYLEDALWFTEVGEGRTYGDIYQELETLVLPPGFTIHKAKRGTKSTESPSPASGKAARTKKPIQTEAVRAKRIQSQTTQSGNSHGQRQAHEENSHSLPVPKEGSAQIRTSKKGFAAPKKRCGT